MLIGGLLGSVIGVPIMWHGEVLGAIHVEDAEPHTLTRNEVELVTREQNGHTLGCELAQLGR